MDVLGLAPFGTWTMGRMGFILRGPIGHWEFNSGLGPLAFVPWALVLDGGRKAAGVVLSW